MNQPNEHINTLTLGAASLLLGVIFVVLFYEHEPGINVFFFAALIVGCGLALSRLFSRYFSVGHYILMTLALVLVFMVFVRSSELLTFFNVLGSALLLLIVAGSFVGKKIRAFLPVDYFLIPFLPFRFLRPFLKTFFEIVSLYKKPGENAQRKEIIRGSLMAVIAIVIFSALFASADAVFDQLLSKIFTFEFGEDFWGRIVMGSIITAFFIGAFGFMYKSLKPTELTPSADNEEARYLGTLEIAILLGAINILFLGFMLIQITYLFGGAAHLTAQGLTYAEYAREGFVQLVFVAILSCVIILFAETQIMRVQEKHFRSFQILSGLLVVQVILILVSAFTRLSLYEEAYGFTTARLFGYAFMIWLGVVLLLLAYHIWANQRQAAFAFRVFGSVIFFLLALNALNPDVFIAKRNLERYAQTGKLDTAYLGALSEDVLPYTVSILEDPNVEIQKSMAYSLYWKFQRNQEERTAWQSARLNRGQYDKLLAPWQAFLEENKGDAPAQTD